jgi:hypothetical protein
MVQEVEHDAQKHGSISQTGVIICGDRQLSKEASPLKNELQIAGFSEEAIREIEKWYCPLPRNRGSVRKEKSR